MKLLLSLWTEALHMLPGLLYLKQPVTGGKGLIILSHSKDLLVTSKAFPTLPHLDKIHQEYPFKMNPDLQSVWVI